MTAYCPTCKGGVPDPLTDFVEWCSGHRPSDAGSADSEVTVGSTWATYASETDPETNSAMCALIHRPNT